MSTISNQDFATEVKSDRLKNLAQLTITLAVFLVVLILTFGQTIWSEVNLWALSILSMIVLTVVGLLVINLLKKQANFERATWLYAIGWMFSIGLLLAVPAELTQQLMPFIFPIVVFIIGLLLSPMSTLFLAILSTFVIIIAPMTTNDMTFGLSIHQFFAIVLMYLSVGLSTQVTGELYQITQWALMNYQKERQTNDELFDKRQALQKSLLQSEALGSQLQEINDELQVATETAEEAKNFRGQFLANMSHELRTPLNAIIGFSETMLKFPVMYDDEKLPNAYERDLNQIFDSGRQLLHVINDILDLAKVDAGKLELHLDEVNIVPITNAVLSTARGLLGSKPVKLDNKLPETLPTVWADEDRLRQVLLNLYSNACKYTDEGMISLSVDITDETLTFSVKDTGVGIPEEFHETLFEEFTQAQTSGRDPRSGSGLGLAITRQLLELMEGRVWLESEEGVGSTFYFSILRYDAVQKREQESTDAQATDTTEIPVAITDTDKVDQIEVSSS